MELTLDQALQKGVEAHKAGKVQEADQYYTAILKANPKHPEANHNMGVLGVGFGKVEQAIPFFKNAVEANSNIAQFWLSYIDALIKIDRITDAKAVLQEAKQKGATGDAFDKIELQLNNSSVEFLNQTKKDIPTEANILDQLKLDKALKLANKKVKDGLRQEAKKIYQDILKKFPKNKGALSGIKTLARTYNSMAITLKEQGKLEEAIEAYTKALSIEPHYAEACYNMGITLQKQGKLEEAIEAYNKALSIKPDYAKSYLNMGVTLHYQGKLNRAIDAYNKALSIDPDFADGYFNLSFAKLKTEQWQHGIELQKWRWKTKSFQSDERCFEAPEWDGKSSIEGKTLLVWGEQGPGDIINWCACLEYYTSIGVNVIVECPRKLVKLLTISFPKITVRTAIRDIEPGKEDFDFQISIATLFGHACVSGKITNRQSTYIFPDQNRVQYWKDRLKQITEKPCIGISWKSPVMTANRQQNYADLSFWKPLLQNEDYTFFNLQSSDFEDDLQKISQDFGVDVINFDDLDHYDDLAEVAAFCKALDKSISIATTVAHISTAVGTQTIIPTWKQSSWNNILFNSRGPKIEVFYRNTWESWENAFNNITKML